MRSIWNGTVSFGLVSIPVKLYSAVSHQSMGFTMLCKKCKTPIKYKRYCPGCQEDVKWSEIIKGLEIGDGQYLTFTQDELDEMKPEKSDRIEIKEFVDLDEIDPIYYNKPYFCAPAKSKERAYFLFKQVLKESKKVAIGRFVMREKEYTCSIRDFKDGLLLSTLNYEYEVRDISDIKELKDAPKLKKDEVDLAKKLVDQLYEEEFDVSEFRDTFAEQLKKMMSKKEKVKVKEVEPEVEMKEESLMEALKASLS